MAVSTVQKNARTTASGTSGLCPAWAVPTIAGNLLLIIINEVGAFTGTWSTPPSGYTAVSPTPSIYDNGPLNPFGIFWKIAAGSDATPGNIGADGGSAGPWLIYTYEFTNTGTGFNASPFDTQVTTAATTTSATSKASGSTATLAQTAELAVAVLAVSTAISLPSFTGGFGIDNPGSGADTRLQVGWFQTSATTALSTTASWTTSAVPGVRIATFKLGIAAAPAFAPQTARAAAMASFMKWRYEGVRSRNVLVFDTTPPQNAIVSPTVSARQPPQPRIDSIISSFDNPLAPTTIPPPVVQDGTPFYRGAPSAFVGAADQLYADVWAAVMQSRTVPDYLAPRGQAVNEFFVPAVIPDSWSSQAQSRNVPDYSPPRSQLFGAFDQQSIWSNVTLGRSVAFYSAPRQLVANVYDPATNSYRDWAPQPVANRPTAFYRGPLSALINVLFSTPFVATDTWIGGPLPRQAGAYRGSYSTFMGAADYLPLDNFTALFQSRQIGYYSPPRSVVSNAGDQGADPWAQVFLSRRVVVLLRNTSQAILTAGAGAAATPDTYASVTTGRSAAFYTAPEARVAQAFDNPPPYALVVGQRAVEFYAALASLAVNAFDNNVAQQLYTALFQGRRVAPYGGSYSSFVGAADQVVLFDPIPQVTQSRPTAPYAPPRARVVSPLTVGALAGQGYVPVAYVRRATLAQVQSLSHTMFPDSDGVIISPNTGGGGEWVIWQAPDFPANRTGAFPQKFNRPSFKRPTRTEKRGY